MDGSASDFDEFVAPVSRQQLVRDAIERATAPKGAARPTLEEQRHNWENLIAFHEEFIAKRPMTDAEIMALPRIPGRITLEMILGSSRLHFESDEEWWHYCFPEMAA